MSRPRNKRTIQMPLRLKGLIPVTNSQTKYLPIQLTIEQYYSIKLLDYENFSQEEASKILNISRPSLTRDYEEARKKISIAMVEGRQILISGGNYKLEDEWYYCYQCESNLCLPNDNEIVECIFCKNINIKKLWEKLKIAVPINKFYDEYFLTDHLSETKYFAIIDTEFHRVDIIKSPYLITDLHSTKIAIERLVGKYSIEAITVFELKYDVYQIIKNKKLGIALVDEYKLSLKDLLTRMNIKSETI